MRTILLAAILLTSLVTFAPGAAAEFDPCDTVVHPCEPFVDIDTRGARAAANTVLRKANCEWTQDNDITCRTP